MKIGIIEQFRSPPVIFTGWLTSSRAITRGKINGLARGAEWHVGCSAESTISLKDVADEKENTNEILENFSLSWTARRLVNSSRSNGDSRGSWQW